MQLIIKELRRCKNITAFHEKLIEYFRIYLLVGGMTEMVAGLEILRSKPCIQRQKMFYWEKPGNSIAEIDYLEIHHLKITPIEIKSGTQGGMKSLWLFMREKHLTEAFRCSLENFGEFEYIDKEDTDAVRHVTILPLYALSQLRK